MIPVSIIGVTSYTGLELLRLLTHHPVFTVRSVTARSAVGKRLAEVFPQLQAVNALRRESSAEEAHTAAFSGRTSSVDPDMIITEEPEQTELAFVCLPHAAAAESVVSLLERGSKVVDLSADFRLRDAHTYELWYKHEHPAPALLETAVYGLCELHRQQIRSTSLVANPGCHATTAILALAPALAAGVIEPAAIIDSKTGVSGAGRTLSLTSHYAEVNEDVNAYSVMGHRHLPEITQELEVAARDGGHKVDGHLRITFIPHLIPMTRGILATSYADLKSDASGHLPSTSEIKALYEEYYRNEPFVHVTQDPPHTKWSLGSNHCFVYPVVDQRTHRLISIACLDNLLKGASGQAIQNANLLCGLPETTGLTALGVYP